MERRGHVQIQRALGPGKDGRHRSAHRRGNVETGEGEPDRLKQILDVRLSEIEQ